MNLQGTMSDSCLMEQILHGNILFENHTFFQGKKVCLGPIIVKRNYGQRCPPERYKCCGQLHVASHVPLRPASSPKRNTGFARVPDKIQQMNGLHYHEVNLLPEMDILTVVQFPSFFVSALHDFSSFYPTLSQFCLDVNCLL